MKTIKILSLGLMMFFITAGCEKENINPSEKTRTGILAVKMTDSPAMYAALNIEITGIALLNNESGWTRLGTETRIIDVLKLTNGAYVPLTRQSNVKIGHYTKIKLIFGEMNQLGLNNHISFPETGPAMVDLAFSGSREIVIDINEIVKPAAYTEILLDFDAARSVIERDGKYFLSPVISAITNARTAVIGDLEAASPSKVTGAIFVVNERDTLSAYTNTEGKFLVRGMSEGIYDVIIYPAVFAPLVHYPEKIHIHGVRITEDQITNLGKIRVGAGMPN